MERVCNSLPVLCAPDGSSVVGPVVVGANVGVDAVGANVGVDVGGGSAVGASVGVAAAGTHHRILFAAAPALVAHNGEVPRVPLPAPWYPPLEYTVSTLPVAARARASLRTAAAGESSPECGYPRSTLEYVVAGSTLSVPREYPIRTAILRVCTALPSTSHPLSDEYCRKHPKHFRRSCEYPLTCRAPARPSACAAVRRAARAPEPYVCTCVSIYMRI